MRPGAGRPTAGLSHRHRELRPTAIIHRDSPSGDALASRTDATAFRSSRASLKKRDSSRHTAEIPQGERCERTHPSAIRGGFSPSPSRCSEAESTDSLRSRADEAYGRPRRAARVRLPTRTLRIVRPPERSVQTVDARDRQGAAPVVLGGRQDQGQASSGFEQATSRHPCDVHQAARNESTRRRHRPKLEHLSQEIGALGMCGACEEDAAAIRFKIPVSDDSRTRHSDVPRWADLRDETAQPPLPGRPPRCEPPATPLRQQLHFMTYEMSRLCGA